MIFKTFVVAMVVLGTYGQNLPSADTLALANLLPYLSPIDNYLFDGPAEIVNAPTTPSTAAKPTLDNMMYYNYYAASMYCQYQLNDLSCKFCQHFKDNVNLYAGNKNLGKMIYALRLINQILNSY